MSQMQQSGGSVAQSGLWNVGQQGTWNVGLTNSVYPAGAEPFVASSGIVANATATASIPAVSGKTAYVTGVFITATGATAGSVVNPSISGLVGGVTYRMTLGVIAGVNANLPSISKLFSFPLPANASNTAITLTVPALGAGNTSCTANIEGYYLTG